MNYQEMSGYELNTRLHNIIECDNKYELKVEGYRVTWTDKKTGEEVVTLRKQYDKSFKDYCGSWADAGPIIQEEKIDLTFMDIENCWCAGKVTPEVFIDCTNHNPLRAAMIVFLMMKGGE